MKRFWLLLVMTVGETIGLSAQDQPGGEQVRQSLGAGYSSMQGLLAVYRLDGRGSFWRQDSVSLDWTLGNDFALVLDKFSGSLGVSYRVTDYLTATVESPLSFDWMFPAGVALSYGGRSKLGLHNRPDPQDQSPGWDLMAEGAVQALGLWNPVASSGGPGGNTSQTVGQPVFSIGQTQSAAYQGTGKISAGYLNEWISPVLAVSTASDLGNASLSEISLMATLRHEWGSRQRSLGFSTSTSLWSSLGDTQYKLEGSWDQISAGAELFVTKLNSTPLFSVVLRWQF